MDKHQGSEKSREKWKVWTSKDHKAFPTLVSALKKTQAAHKHTNACTFTGCTLLEAHLPRTLKQACPNKNFEAHTIKLKLSGQVLQQVLEYIISQEHAKEEMGL